LIIGIGRANCRSSSDGDDRLEKINPMKAETMPPITTQSEELLPHVGTTSHVQEPNDSTHDTEVSWISSTGLNASNFFVAASGGVILPFTGAYLVGQGWGYDDIGLAGSIAGLTAFLSNAPAGMIVDRVRSRRLLLALTAVAGGFCVGAFPLVPATWGWIVGLLIGAGILRAFPGPLLGALALALVGYNRLNRLLGVNQGWNHAGTLAAAAMAMMLVGWIGIPGVFFAGGISAVFVALAVFLIRSRELDESQATGREPGQSPSPSVGTRAGLFRDRGVIVLLISSALFHLANAPIMPLVAQQVTHLQGGDHLVAAVVLVAQLVMIPVAVFTGWLGYRKGNKLAMAVGFLALPIRIALYAVADSSAELVALQALDGIGAGVFGVASIALCADLTHGKGGFNTLAGFLATAVGTGGVIGPVVAGAIVQRWGFAPAYLSFAAVAALAAVVFLLGMPDLRRRMPHSTTPPI
jgi:MFS family permease